MIFYIEQVGLGEMHVHSTRYCQKVKSQSALAEKDVPTYDVRQAARVVGREVGLATVRACGACGESYSPSGTGGYSGGGSIEEEEIQA